MWRTSGKRRVLRRAVGALVAVGALLTSMAVSGADVAAADPYPTADGRFSGTGVVGPGGVVDLRVLGRGGVPDVGVGAVALNVTVTNATAGSFVTVWPSGELRPVAASLTVSPGSTVSNMVVVGVGASGAVSLFNHAGDVDVIVDVLGWFPTDTGAGDSEQPGGDGSYVPVRPARVQDTRPGYPTIDGLSSGTGVVGPGGVVDVHVAGRGGVPDAGVGAVALNVTVTNATAGSFVTVWPSGELRPVAASLTMSPGSTVSNMVVVGVGASGAVSLFNHAGDVDVIVDVLGWFPTGTGTSDDAYVPVSPSRLVDSRPGYATVDGAFAATGTIDAGGTLDLTVIGRGGLPGHDVAAVVLNVTATEPTALSFVAVWPAGRLRPLTATFTTAPGAIVSNLVIVGVGDDGRVSMYNHAGSTHLVVDVLGYVPASHGPHGERFRSLTPARLQDTRMPAPPPREPGYPTGRCDSIAPGMNGIQLRDDETPDAYERIGTSVLGQPIWAEYYGPATPTSVVLVIGQVHGDECAPSRFVRAVRAKQRREYGVWLIPTLDPDGYAWYSRYNITGRDLNTDGWTVSQPETRALMAFTAKVRPVLTVHVHSPNGQIGWYGLGSYVPDDPGRSGAVLSGQIAQYVAARSGLEMAGAGSRSDRSRWLLWQGQRLVHPTGDSLLVEVHAVADSEVPFARPRPATQPVAVVDAECQLVLAALDRYLGS